MWQHKFIDFIMFLVYPFYLLSCSKASELCHLIPGFNDYTWIPALPHILVTTLTATLTNTNSTNFTDCNCNLRIYNVSVKHNFLNKLVYYSGQHVSTLIVIFSPFLDTDPYLTMFKMHCGIPNAYIIASQTRTISLYKNTRSKLLKCESKHLESHNAF